MEEGMLLLALGLPMVGSLVLALAGRRMGARVGWLALVVPLMSTALLGALAMNASLPGRWGVEVAWVPALGLNLSFVVDGLSMMFGLVVSGMGCLVMFHAIFYLGPDFRHAGRFYSYLALFMGAMLGTVFSDHVVLLFVFWELTGVASFLLIGFLHGEEKSRVGARQALLVTGSTGLALFAGVMLLQRATGTASLSVLLERGLPWSERGGELGLAMVLMLVGAFGKSAQFPFHFWLLNAMAAPTPVSAYLHSATMVKLGVFLVARIYPLFVVSPWWMPLLGTVGFTTMVLAAVLALVSHDLKSILAWSTISQLGYLLGQYGMGPEGGVGHDQLHLVSHVLYKGCLFMVAGVVMHATGLRDVREMGGLFGRLPMLGMAAVLAGGSMAGLPGTLGFVGKEAMLADLFRSVRDGGDPWGWYAVGCVGVASVAKIAFSLRLVAGVFFGKEPDGTAAQYHAPGLGMQLPALLLAAGVLLLGVWPGLLDGLFGQWAVEGLNRPKPLSVWHGWSVELLASGGMMMAGVMVYEVGRRTGWRGWRIPEVLGVDKGFEWLLERFQGSTKAWTRRLGSDRPAEHLSIVVGFVVMAMGVGMVGLVPGLMERLWPEEVGMDPLRTGVAGLIAMTVVGVLLLRRWTAQLISLAVAGFLTCFYFVLYRAPDLALTQILVETVTLILVLLLLARFPESVQVGEETRKPGRWTHYLHIGLALATGCVATGLILVVTSAPHPEPLGERYLEQTVPLAKGSNAVNTLLVDFRGFDTLGEVTVLVVATLGCLGLLMRYKRTPEENRQGPMGPPGFGVEERGED
jgi:NADH:ubiquinone oxidoreductase subunit 5 (subunit L)/multisubunit Na+/H+ antiporter MnhA subunit